MTAENGNLYKPHIVTVTDVWVETPTIKTFRMVFDDPKVRDSFTFKAGQFGEYSVFGEGEATFCIASSPTRKGYIECSVKEVARMTHGLHLLDVGDKVGFRGPYGNWFPLEEMKGKKLMFIGGGIGLAPLRSLIQNVLDTRKDFDQVDIIYAARCEEEFVYKREIEEWKASSDCGLCLAVDPIPDQVCSDDVRVSFIPPILEEMKPDPKNRIVITCGPPIMIKLVTAKLEELGWPAEQIITTLEMKMKCGLGKCGRCNIGSTYVCKDGPVFTYEQIRSFPQEY